MARHTSRGLGPRLVPVAILAALVAAGWWWWETRNYIPPPEAYPTQGAEIGAEDGAVNWRVLKAIGAQFVYLDASASAFARDDRFAANLEDARAARLQVGAVHRYDPCQPAEKQAANFVTMVPRDAKLLPPAIDLSLLADDCPIKVGNAAVISELMTFINQIETHTGKPALLKLARPFETRYRIAAALDRNLWLIRDRFQPRYAGRPWMLWTANGARPTAAATGGIRWVAVQP